MANLSSDPGVNVLPSSGRVFNMPPGRDVGINILPSSGKIHTPPAPMDPWKLAGPSRQEQFSRFQTSVRQMAPSNTPMNDMGSQGLRANLSRQRGEISTRSLSTIGVGSTMGPTRPSSLPSNAAVGGAAGGGATGSAVESAISKGVGAVDGFVTQQGNKAVNAFKGMDWAAARGNWKQLGGHLWNTKPMLRGSAYLAGAGLALGAVSGLLRDDRSMVGNTFGAAGSMIGSGLTFGVLGAAGGAAFGAAKSGMALRKAGLAMGSKMGAATMGAGGMRMIGKGGMYGAMAGMAFGALGNAFGSRR